jgi:hypothetical protein
MSTDPIGVLFRRCADDLTSGAVPPPVEMIRAQATSRSGSSAEPHPAERSRSRTRSAAVVGLAATALAVLLIFQTLPGPTGSAPPAAAAAAVVVLERAAEAAAAEDQPAPGRYMLVEAIRTMAHTVVPAAGGEAVTYLQDETNRTWTAVDGKGEGLTEVIYGKITWLAPEDRSRLATSDLHAAEGQVERYATAGPSASDLPPGHTRQIEDEGGQRIEVIRNAAGEVVSRAVLVDQDEAQEPHSPTYRRLLDLPTDPGALYVEITRDAGPSPQDALDLVGVLLGYNIAPPDVRAALYLAAKRIPGVDLVPDYDGRRQTVVLGVTGRDTRTELILNSDTGELLGRRHVTVVDDALKGAPAATTILTEARSAKFTQTLGQ